MNSRAYSRVRAQSGFTFLELLLVLVLLSVCAALSFPRFSGVYGQLRYERQKRAIRKLVLRAERDSRLTGARLLLSWNADGRTFTLCRADEASPHSGAASRFGWDDQYVSAREFLEFVFRAPEFLGEGESGFGGVNDAQAETAVDLLDPVDAVRRQRAIARLRIEGLMEVHTVSFPVVFAPTGHTSEGSIFTSAGAGTIEELRIPQLAISADWVDS